MSHKKLKEFELIERIRNRMKYAPEVWVGIGDDTAVLKIPGQSQVVLFTVDNVVEGIHFVKGTHERLIGRKALARSLSDIAAMGGIPKYAVLTLGLPKRMTLKSVDSFLDGFLKLAKTFKVDLVGGDITKSPGKFFVSVALLGQAKENQYILRKGARPEDLLFVTGTLGGSIAKKHLHFKPRIQEGHWLAKHGIASSMIDLSDGLAGDLRHLLKESRVGASLFAEKIPISKTARRLAQRGGPSAFERALKDGEDYELLFSSSRRDLSWIAKFEKKFHVPVSCIGYIIQPPFKVEFKNEKGKTKELRAKGFTHF
jgi:thiamine-monophosphate kinase